MGFLDNSGDIILDAVLTDAGRARLARGDGSFKIVKYAFADDEIDYAKYDLNHTSGSAYFDINILTTPVIEALTNNMSTMKNRLLTIPKTNLLYLPVIKLNEEEPDAGFPAPERRTNGLSGILAEETTFFVSANESTDDFFKKQGAYANTGPTSVPDGVNSKGSVIAVDQGLNTTAIAKSFSIDPTLQETQYIVEIDNRLGYIVDNNGEQQQYSYLDDDNIASYSFSTSNGSIVKTNLNEKNNSPIAGPRGSRLQFRVVPSIEINSSTYLFTLLGTSNNLYAGPFGGSAGVAKFRRIDTNIRITGATTGYRISIPVSFLRIQ